jgi:hypothetical protein
MEYVLFAEQISLVGKDFGIWITIMGRGNVEGFYATNVILESGI